MPSFECTAGRGLVAARDLEEAETVLAVQVDAHAPCWPCEPEELSTEESAVLREDLGAGETFGGDHLAGELQSLWLLATRCALLSRSDPPKFAALLALQDHGSERPRLKQLTVIGGCGWRFVEDLCYLAWNLRCC